MTTKEKLTLLNEYLEIQGKKQLKGWSKSTAALDARLDKEHDAASNHLASQKEADSPKSKKSKADKKDAKTTIAKVCRQGFTDELSNDQIHAQLEQLNHEGRVRYDASKKWYITWYRSAERRKANEQGRGINEG